MKTRQAGMWATGGSVLSAVASSACCWLPLALIGFGASAVGVATFFERYRTLFLIAATLLLGAGFYFNYFNDFRRAHCAPDSACEVPGHRLRRFNRGVLWIATALVLVFALFPSYVGVLIGAPQAPAAHAGAGASRAAELAIEGMTCSGCAATVEKALHGVSGVLRADVSYEEKRAVVELDTEAATADASLVEAVKNAGYTATAIKTETTPAARSRAE